MDFKGTVKSMCAFISLFIPREAKDAKYSAALGVGRKKDTREDFWKKNVHKTIS